MSETQTTVAPENKMAGATTAPAILNNSNGNNNAPQIKTPEPIAKEEPLLYFGKEVRIGSRKIQLIRIEHFNLIPKTKEAKGIRDEITIKVGSQWKKGTRDIIRGLTPEEEKKFLPTILGVNANSEKWEEKVWTHWADFNIQIPNNDVGITLEAGFKVVKLGNGTKEIVPIMLDDYMKYCFCKENGKVANEGEDNLQLFDCMMIDKAKKQAEDEIAFAAKKGIERDYLVLVQSKEASQRLKIDWILETIGGEDGTGMNINGLSEIQKEMELERIKNKHLDKFIEIMKDEDLQLKALIRKAIGVGKLELQGDTYILGNKPLGLLADTLGYYKNPNNVKDRQLLEMATK